MMKIADLKKLERSLWKQMKLLEKHKDFRLAAKEEKGKAPVAISYETINGLWLATYDELKRQQLAAAARKDKGEPLWTVFVPKYPGKAYGYVVEVVRTALRQITDRSRDPYRAHSEMRHEDLRDGRLYGPDHDFRNAMEGKYV